MATDKDFGLEVRRAQWGDTGDECEVSTSIRINNTK